MNSKGEIVQRFGNSNYKKNLLFWKNNIKEKFKIIFILFGSNTRSGFACNEHMRTATDPAQDRNNK